MKKEVMRTLIQKIAVGAFCLTVFWTAVCPMTVFAAEPQTIRVGYFAFPGYHEVIQSESGPQGSGYGFDFLQMLRRYTNLNYQMSAMKTASRICSRCFGTGRSTW